MKNKRVGNFIKERIKENKDLFTVDEMNCIKKNERCVNKIYLLGFIDSRQCYKKD